MCIGPGASAKLTGVKYLPAIFLCISVDCGSLILILITLCGGIKNVCEYLHQFLNR